MCCTVVGPSSNLFSMKILDILIRDFCIFTALHFFMMQEIALFYSVPQIFRCYCSCILACHCETELCHVLLLCNDVEDM
jgi:hypothetical protein